MYARVPEPPLPEGVTMKRCVPRVSPINARGDEHANGNPPSSAHVTPVAGPLSVQEKIAVVHVVDAGGADVKVITGTPLVVAAIVQS